MESNLPLPDDLPPPVATGPTKDEKTMAMLCHLLAFSGFIFPMIPGASIIGPLILWAIKKDHMPYVDSQGKEAINFNITVSIIVGICMLTFWLLLPIAILFGVAIAAIVLTIIAAINASDGKPYRYPFILRLVK